MIYYPSDICLVELNDRKRIMLLLDYCEEKFLFIPIRFANRHKDKGNSMYIGNIEGLRGRSTICRCQPSCVDKSKIMKRIAQLPDIKFNIIYNELFNKRKMLQEKIDQLYAALYRAQINCGETSAIQNAIDDMHLEQGYTLDIQKERYRHAPSKSIKVYHGG